MTIHSFASDLSARIPELARDGALNRQQLIEQMLREFLNQYDKQKEDEASRKLDAIKKKYKIPS